MALELIEIINGILMIILCCISISVGLKIISTYFKNKEINYVYAGLFWIGLVCPWYPGSISFLMYLFSGTVLTAEQYFIIGNVGAPMAITCWIAAFTGFFFKKTQKVFVGLYIIYDIIFYILFFVALSIDPRLIGVLQGQNQIDVDYSFYMVIYYATLLITILITGILFARASIQSNNPEFKLRGYFLLIAFIFYVIGGFIDAITLADLFFLLIQRIFQILSVLAFYVAFILPEPVKKLILKQ